MTSYLSYEEALNNTLVTRYTSLKVKELWSEHLLISGQAHTIPDALTGNVCGERTATPGTYKVSTLHPDQYNHNWVNITVTVREEGIDLLRTKDTETPDIWP